MRKKLILGGLIVAGGAVAAAVLLPQSAAPDAAPEPEAKAAARLQGGASSEERLAALPSREAMGRPAGEPFGSQAWVPARPAAPIAPIAAAPSAPPMPYRVAGQMVREGSAHIVLAKGDRILAVREGETLEDGYRVEAIKADGVTLVYLPMNLRETLPLNSALGLEAPAAKAALAAAGQPAAQSTDLGVAQAGEARPAQLRWEGPARVQAGNNFNVSLKVTSDQPVRASPLQVSYDAALLEPVGVRAGDFFAGGSFSYRIVPGGSIMVGALGAGEVAADAEFLVVTFRPIRAGATADVRLSSVLLQGSAGRAIVHAQPAAFRTAIQ